MAEGLTAISNGSEVDRATAGGCTVIRFADTMAMSTYLVAFVVGRLEATDPVEVNGVPLRVVHVLGSRASPLFEAPQMDALYHLEWARAVAAGLHVLHDIVPGDRPAGLNLALGREDGSIDAEDTRKTALVIFSMVDGVVRFKIYNLYDTGALFNELINSCRKILKYKT